MKKLLLPCLAATLLFVSCSDDDNTPGTDPNAVYLKTMKQHMADEDIVFNYTNGRLTSANFTTAGQPTAHTTVVYGEHGLIINITTYDTNNTILSTRSCTYDNQERINHTESHEYTQGVDYSSSTDFIFNTDNTITSTTNSSWGSTVKTFYLNSSTVIYKEVSGDSVYELTLDGENPVAATSAWGTTTFEYDTTHNMLLLGIQSQTGNYKPNAVLLTNSLEDNDTAIITKYLIKETSGDDVREFQYTFDTAGRPVKRMDYNNGILYNEMEYLYE
jgi:hypothetical protein